MKRYILFSIILLGSSCQYEFNQQVVFEIDGLFTSPEIGLITQDPMLANERYFSIHLANNDTLPITIATTSEEKYYSPLGTTYSYFSKKYSMRKAGGGASDFFSTQKTTILPSQSRQFYFYAAIPPNTDTVDLVFKYLKRDSICFVETRHFLKHNKVMNLLNYHTFCE